MAESNSAAKEGETFSQTIKDKNSVAKEILSKMNISEAFSAEQKKYIEAFCNEAVQKAMEEQIKKFGNKNISFNESYFKFSLFSINNLGDTMKKVNNKIASALELLNYKKVSKSLFPEKNPECKQCQAGAGYWGCLFNRITNSCDIPKKK